MTVKSADKRPEKYVGPDGKPKIRMVHVDKNVTNEVSKGKIGRYLKKVPASAADAGRKSSGAMGIGPEDQKKQMKKGISQFVNRQRGTTMAVDKMTGKAKVPATEEAEKHVFRFSTKTKQGNIHHSSKDHKSAADAIQKRTGEKVQSMTYKGTVSAMPKRRARVAESLVGYKGSDTGAGRHSTSATSSGRHNSALATLKGMAKKHEKEHEKSDHLGHDDALKAIDHAGSKLNKHGADHPEFKSAMNKAKDASKTAMKMNNEDSDAVKAFLAKGGKIKKLPPAKAQGYHGKDDPGKDMHGVMDKPDTKAIGTRKKVKSMEGKKFSDLRAQIAEGYASYAQQKAAHASMAERGKKKSKNESMLGHRDAEKLNGGKSRDSNFKSPESHIDHHHRQTGGHNKSGGDQDRHRYQVAKKLGYDV